MNYNNDTPPTTNQDMGDFYAGIQGSNVYEVPTDGLTDNIDIGYANSMNITLVGGPEASNTISSNMGYPGAAFTITTSPYSTDKAGSTEMKGLIPVPYNGDSIGTNYHGDLTVKDLTVNGGVNNHTIDIYYSNNADTAKLSSLKDVDLTSPTQDWHQYNANDPNSDPSVLKDAKVFYYHVHGTMNWGEKDVNVNVTYQTLHNLPKDKYVNQSLVTASNYAPGTGNASNTSTFVAYQIVENHFAGTIWHDLNKDGLLNNSEPGIGGIHIRLFKLNTDTAQYEPAQDYDLSKGQPDTNGTITAADGSYSLVACADGTYKVGISKNDLDKLQDTLTQFEIGSTSTLYSQFKPSETATDENGNTFYLSDSSNVLPIPTAITQPAYDFENINAGLLDHFGGLDLSIPKLYFGKHNNPQKTETYSNQTTSGTGTPNNTIAVADSRSFAYDSYHVTAQLNSFTNDQDNSVGLQAAELNFVPTGNQSPIPILMNQENSLFEDTATTPGSVTDTFKDIQLVVPPNSANNVVKKGTYQATVDYALTNGPE